MEKLIYPCVWSDNNALEMAHFYISVFPNTEIVHQNKWVVVLKMKDQRVMLLIRNWSINGSSNVN